MSRRVWLAALLLLLAVGLGACAQRAPEGAPVDTLAQEGADLPGAEEPLPQQQALIALRGDPSSGYSWMFAMTPEGVIDLLESSFEPDSGEEGPGTFHWTFVPVAQGEVELTMMYTQGQGAPYDTVSYVLAVDDEGSMSMVSAGGTVEAMTLPEFVYPGID